MRRRAEISNLAESFESLRSDYAAAKTSRFRRKRTGTSVMGSGADYHYRTQSDFLRMLEDARDMDRNDCVIGQTIDRAVTNEIQDGLDPDPQTGDKGADKALWENWSGWAGNPDLCDVAGEHSFHEMQHLVMRHVKLDGDILALPTREASLQLVEAHRPRTPTNTSRNVIHGIRLDDRRRRVEYWLTKDDVSPLAAVTRVSDIQKYPARDADGHKQVFHVYNPKRVTQTRGVTALAPIFDVCGMFEDIQFAKLVQQQIVSCFAFIRMREAGFDGPDVPGQKGERVVETNADGSTRRVEGVSPGMEILGAPGEKIEGFSPQVPNAEFFQHVRLILTLVGINLGMPLVLLLLDASETNFSGFRGAVDQARLGFRRNQRWLIERLLRPVYRWKVRQWLAEDPALRAAAEKSGVNIFGHRWQPPRWPYIEPLKDASTDLLRVRNGLTSPRRLHGEHGDDWEEIYDEIVADNAQAIRRAKKEAVSINSEFKDDQPVHWRELLSLPTPDGIQVALAAAGDGDKPSSQKPGDKQNAD